MRSASKSTANPSASLLGTSSSGHRSSFVGSSCCIQVVVVVVVVVVGVGVGVGVVVVVVMVVIL